MADLLHKIKIAASPARVFDALATPEGISHWWTEDSTAGQAAGTVSTFTFMRGHVVFRMQVDAYEPARLLAWTCLGDYDEWNGTTLRWTLKPTDDGGTTLRLVHGGWASTENEFPQCNTSWGHLLHILKSHLEGGPSGAPASGRR